MYAQDRREIFLVLWLIVFGEDDFGISKINSLPRVGAKTTEDPINGMVIFRVNFSKKGEVISKE